MEDPDDVLEGEHHGLTRFSFDFGIVWKEGVLVAAVEVEDVGKLSDEVAFLHAGGLVLELKEVQDLRAALVFVDGLGAGFRSRMLRIGLGKADFAAAREEKDEKEVEHNRIVLPFADGAVGEKIDGVGIAHDKTGPPSLVDNPSAAPLLLNTTRGGRDAVSVDPVVAGAELENACLDSHHSIWLADCGSLHIYAQVSYR